MFTRSVSPEAAPDQPTYITIDFENGDPVAVDDVRYSPAQILAKLNECGGANGIGRLDLVESRYVGMKVRGGMLGKWHGECCSLLVGIHF